MLAYEVPCCEIFSLGERWAILGVVWGLLRVGVFAVWCGSAGGESAEHYHYYGG